MSTPRRSGFIQGIASGYLLRLGSLLIVVAAWNTAASAQNWTYANGTAYFPNVVGIGQTPNAAGELFQVAGNVDGNISLRFQNFSTGSSAQSTVLLYNDVGWSGMTQTGSHSPSNEFRIQSNSAITGGIVIRTLTNADIKIAPNDSTALIVKGNGNVGIGDPNPTVKFHVVGDALFSGNVTGDNIQAKYQDVAEWVPSTKVLEPGTVVVLDPDEANHVRASETSYDTRVAGVVSDNPGILLGQGGEGKVRIATMGRVKVRVHSDRGVRIGDLLVTSDEEGTAMVSEPLDIGGVKCHRPGTLIGKALDSMKPGTGKILVLVSLQ